MARKFSTNDSYDPNGSRQPVALIQSDKSFTISVRSVIESISDSLNDLK